MLFCIETSLGFSDWSHYNQELQNWLVGKTMRHPNVDPAEIQKFGKLSSQWWDPTGPFKTLHDINPLRLSYITSCVNLKDKKVLDIGCGGGLLTEEMAKLGAEVTGLDMSEDAIAHAKLHQAENKLEINYQIASAEDFASLHPQSFDVIICFELLEHIPHPPSLINACATLLKPSGDLLLSTLNRSMKSYLFAILGAEYIFHLLPKNTHDFAKFIRPSELDSWCRRTGFRLLNLTGLNYNIFSKKYHLGREISVNYLAHFKKSL